MLISHRRDDGGGGEEGRHNCLLPLCYDAPDSHGSGQPRRAAPLASPWVSRPYVLGKGSWQMLPSLEERRCVHVLLAWSRVSCRGRVTETLRRNLGSRAELQRGSGNMGSAGPYSSLVPCRAGGRHCLTRQRLLQGRQPPSAVQAFSESRSQCPQ